MCTDHVIWRSYGKNIQEDKTLALLSSVRTYRARIIRKTNTSFLKDRLN